ncbi:hypothetical protein CPB97_003529 [Podila verticillata]|nr:hypothetical protein CPB97_003529 [Podila verticillata]
MQDSVLIIPATDMQLAIVSHEYTFLYHSASVNSNTACTPCEANLCYKLDQRTTESATKATLVDIRILSPSLTILTGLFVIAVALALSLVHENQSSFLGPKWKFF